MKGLARNVIWNWGGMAANMLAGFVVAPFLVHRLGQTVYGLWILVASLIYYFGLLDLGVRGAVGRQLAFHRAQNDREGLNQTLNTALALLWGMGLVALLGTLVVIAVFFNIFEVPADQVSSVRVALLLVGVNLLLWLPLSLFDATLWAYQRFDLINAVDITWAAIRVGLTFYLIEHGGGLVALALVNLVTLAGGQATKGIIVFRLDRGLRLGWQHLSAKAARGVLGIGFWNSLLALAGVVNGQAGPLIVGASMSVAMVTPFSIAARLMGYGRDFVVASTGVLTPVVIGFHANRRLDEQQRLFLQGGRYCLALALFFVGLFVFLGEPIIHVWMGPSLAWAAKLLVIFALGEAIPMSQWVSNSIVIGKYRHRTVAWIAVVENVMAITLALILGRWYGLTGICLGFVIPATLCRGVFQLLYTCRLVRVPLGQYLSVVVGPMAAAAFPAMLGLALAVRRYQPESWLGLGLYATGFAVAYGAVVAGVLGYDWLRAQSHEIETVSLKRRLVTALQSVW